MTYMSTYMDPASMRERALKSLTMPIGLANPLWFAFTAAAGAGAAWWLMTRWARPLNFEAILPLPVAAPALTLPPEAPAGEAVVAVAHSVTEALTPEEPVVEAFVAETQAMEADAAAEGEHVLAEMEAIVEASPVADDLTRLIGVGPRTAAALANRGITRFAQLAAWSAEELAAFDAEMSLKGRSLRDAWIDQAKALAGQ